MRKLLFLPILTLAFACNDAPVFQPDEDLTASFTAAAAEWTPFCTTVVLAGPVGTPDLWMTGKVSHFCGGNEWTHLDDLLGTSVHRGCMTTNTVTGTGTGHGSLAMDLTEAFGDPVEGGFEGKWLLNSEGTYYTGKWWGKGYGDFEGTKMEADVDFDFLSPPYVVCGSIFDPKGG